MNTIKSILFTIILLVISLVASAQNNEYLPFEEWEAKHYFNGNNGTTASLFSNKKLPEYKNALEAIRKTQVIKEYFELKKQMEAHVAKTIELHLEGQRDQVEYISPADYYIIKAEYYEATIRFNNLFRRLAYELSDTKRLKDISNQPEVFLNQYLDELREQTAYVSDTFIRSYIAGTGQSAGSLLVAVQVIKKVVEFVTDVIDFKKNFKKIVGDLFAPFLVDKLSLKNWSDIEYQVRRDL